jgi:hypothetical protein
VHDAVRVDQHVAMGFDFGRAESAEEVEAVQRLRYAVYVEEMGRYRDVDGADDSRFAEPEDQNGWIVFARDGADMVAASRTTWGGHGFSPRQIEQYQLAPFLAEIPAEMMAVGERNTVLAAYRGTGVLEQTTAQFSSLMVDRDIRLVFGCCEPHLLSLYLKMGQRTYAVRNINSPAAGYLIPLVSFVPDADALRGVGMAAGSDRLPACVEAVLTRVSTVRSEILSAPDEYWSEVRRTLDDIDAQQLSIFDDFTDDETKRCISRSTIIECAAGDRVLKRGGTARNIFVVLDGTLEVRDDETDATRVLSLSEGALRHMIAEDATMAAKLLLNLSKVLCVKLIRTH